MRRKPVWKVREIVSVAQGKLRAIWRRCRWLLRELSYRRWVIETHISRPVSLATDRSAVILIPSYHEKRIGNLQPLVRAALKCSFVEKVIISNHNPEVCLEGRIEIGDDRVTVINQPVRRGCGYGWVVANQQEADYFIVIDDDMLVRPQQLATLFQRLVEAPESPHGFIGRLANGTYVLNQEAEAVFIYNIYAVTKFHVRKYIEYVEEITSKGYASQESIEYWGDDLILSQSGTQQPRVHKAGSIFQCKTTETRGVATYVDSRFEKHRHQVYQALLDVKFGSAASLFSLPNLPSEF